MYKKILINILSIIFCVGFLKGVSINTESTQALEMYRDNEKMSMYFSRRLTREQVIEDIKFALNVIKQNHVAAINQMPHEVLKQESLEISKLPILVSSVDEWRIISRIFAKLHDGHTIIREPDFLNGRLPFDTECVDGRFFCKTEEFRDFEITEINGITIDELYKIFKEHFSYEIEEWPQYNFFESPSNYISDWKLALVGINIFNPIEVTFKKAELTIIRNFCLVPIKFSQDSQESWISYKIDKENNLGIFKLDECEVNDEYIKKVNDFFLDVDKNKIKNIVIDLRENIGGTDISGYYFLLFLKNLKEIKTIGYDIRCGDVLIHGDPMVLMLKDISNDEFPLEDFRKLIPLYDGNVFILTSHATFSAGKDFAVMFADNGLGRIVGEVSGNSPTQFGETTDEYQLPNSKLKFNTTSKKFYRPDFSKDQNRLIPDIQIKAKYALDKVYEIIKTPNLSY